MRAIMQGGDLATSTRPRIVVVLEGVLATLAPIESRHGLLRRTEVSGYNVLWHDTPLKRIATMKRQYPETAIDVLTFVSQDIADVAAEFFMDTGIPVDAVHFEVFDRYVSALPYQADVMMVLDSEADRLDRYGQLGRATLMGEDFF